MRATKRNPDLTEDGEAYIALGLLLRKARDEDSSNEVERILRGKMPLQEKIAEIAKIDRIDARGAPQTEGDGGEKSVKRPLRYSVSDLGAILKTPHTRLGYLKFLFHELSQMIRFGSETHIFAPVFLPPSIKVDPGIISFLNEEMRGWCRQLCQTLQPVTENGWRHLTKVQFNLIVVLYRLATKIAETDFALFNLKERDFIDKFRVIETLFYVFHYDPQLLETFIATLEYAVAAEEVQPEDVNNAVILTERLLRKDINLPSLHNLLLGLNMVKYRRYLTIDDLISRNLGVIVNGNSYAVTPKVFGRMVEFIHSTKDDLDRLERQLHEARRISRTIKRTKEGEVDFSSLKRFYDFSRSEDATRDFELDQSNIMFFAPRLFRQFDRVFFPLLTGQVTLDGVGRKAVFHASVFQDDFARLEQVLQRFDRIALNFPLFSYQHYLKLKTEHKGAIAVESDVIQCITDAIAVLGSVGKQLASVLSNYAVPQNNEEASPIESTLDTGKSIPVPFAGTRVVGRSVLHDMEVIDAMGLAASVCFLSAVYFRDEAAIGALKRRRSIQRTMLSKLNALRMVGGDESCKDYEHLVPIIVQTELEAGPA